MTSQKVQNIKALILSAGLGTRLQPYTFTKAKPAIEFFGIPTLYFSIFPLLNMGLSDLFINLHHKPETVRKVVDLLDSLPFNIQFSEETPEILGSAGAIGKIKDQLSKQDQLLVLNGDNASFFFNEAIQELSQQQQKQGHFADVLIAPHEKAGKGLSSAWIDEEGLIAGFGVEAPREGLRPYHFLGVIAFGPQSFSHFKPEFSNTLFDIITPAIKEGHKVGSLIREDLFFHESGNITDYQLAHEKVLQLSQTENQFVDYLDQLCRQLKLPLEIHQGPKKVEGWELMPESLAVLPKDKKNYPKKLNLKGFIGINTPSAIKNIESISNLILSSENELNSSDQTKNCLILNHNS